MASLVSTVNERDRQCHVTGTPKNKDAKRLDLFGRKVYSMASLQFRVSNHQVLLGRYNFNLWDLLNKFKEVLPQDHAQEFAALVDDGLAVAKGVLQMAWDATDLVARVVACAVAMRCSSWFQSSGLSREMQATIQDLPFEGTALFSELIDVRLHGLKDSRTALCSIGLCPSAGQEAIPPSTAACSAL